MTCHVDAETIETYIPGGTRSYHRDVTRDLTIAMLDVLFDEEFTHGPWYELSPNDIPTTVELLDEFPKLYIDGHYSRCEIVSPTRRYTLYLYNAGEELVGFNSQRDAAVQYDVDALLDNKTLVAQASVPLVLS